MKLLILCLALAGCALAMPVDEIKDESSPAVVAPKLTIGSASEELAAPGEPAQPADAPKISPAVELPASLGEKASTDAQKTSEAAVPKIDIVEASKTLAGVADEAVPSAFDSPIPVPQKKIDLPVTNVEPVLVKTVPEKSASATSDAALATPDAAPATPDAAPATLDAAPAKNSETDETVRKVRQTVDDKKEIKEEAKIETVKDAIPEPAAQGQPENDHASVLKRQTELASKDAVNSEEDSKSIEETTADGPKKPKAESHESVESSVEKISAEKDDDDDESEEKVKEKLTPLSEPLAAAQP